MKQSLIDRDGDLFLIDDFIGVDEADCLHRQLLDELAWREETLRIAGREVKAPRLTCWYGDPGAVYAYSGIVHDPLPWTPLLTRLRYRVEAVSGHAFNSVLANLYRDGGDSMGWHADNERSLGPAPCIASLSLGDRRLFKVRHNRSGETLAIDLAGGSLLLMGGAFQRHWRHCVPKTRQLRHARINLTFRAIIAPDARRPTG